MGLIVGIDVGGTFTDVVAWDPAARRLYATKVPSTPPHQEAGVVRGVHKILEIAGRGCDQVDRIIHGTTVSLNAILERKGARLGILTTAGFEGTLAIGRARRTVLYDYFLEAETPRFLCPQRRIFGIPERVGPEGEEIQPLEEEAVARAVDELRDRHQVEAIVVCYLHAYANPEHEQRTLEILRQRFPEVRVSLSSVVDPRFREYERLCITAFDAYVKPVTERYIRDLEGRLAEMGVRSRLQIMQCRGGITDAGSVLERPVVTIMSGPAAGVIGGNFAGELAGFGDLITVDIGGTSCDVALVRGNEPLISLEGKVQKYPLRQPMVDVSSIGAGGGSIAWIDAGGGLRVGPQSAGARPGPACYGQGGTEPTVTDASLVLGYLNPGNFGCGEIALRPELAREAVASVAGRLGLGVEEAALGIHRILNTRMAEEMRLASVGHGYDPRQFALVALGGGGGVHACRLAELLSIPRVVVPPVPGVLSAMGLLVASIEHEHSATYAALLEEVDPGAMDRAFAELEGVVRQRMAADGVPAEAIRSVRSAEMRYFGQAYEIEIPLPGGPIDPAALGALAGAFHRRHEEVYNHSMPGSPVEIVNLRVVQSYPLPRPHFEPEAADGRTPEAALIAHRPAMFDLAQGYVETPVYDRTKLGAGAEIEGPAIVEQSDTTVLLCPGHRARVDAFRNLIVDVPVACSETSDPALTPTLSQGERGRTDSLSPWERGGVRAGPPVPPFSRRVDPITLEVIRNKLDMIVQEMQTTLIRVSHTPIVKHGQDTTAALFDVRGNTLAQASAIPAHLQMLIPAVNRVLEEFPPAGMQPDDIYVLNDPYDGGTHLPDFVLVMPIFFQGEPVALASTMTHHQDVGGKAPGSTPPDATEYYAEGIAVPVLKLYDRGELNGWLMKVLRRNVRIPDSFEGDLMAQVACCKTGARRVMELFGEHGIAMVWRHFDALMDHSERMSRAAIEAIPDGDYSFCDYLDSNGLEPHTPVKIQVTVKVRGSEMVADFSGTDPEAKGGINCVPSSTGAGVFFVARAIGGPDIPNNAGAYRPIKMHLPYGTIVNARPPHALGARSITLRRIASAMQGAMALAIPHRIPAAWEGASNLLYLGGVDPGNGRRFVTLIGIPIVGGTGGRPDRDGVDVISGDTSNLQRVPAEAFELDFPFRLLDCDLATDSAGPGLWRGGLGHHATVEVLRGEYPLTIRRDRHDFAPWGLFGGKAAPRNRITIHRADGQVEEMPSMIMTRVAAGDRLEFFTTGGGGYGDPLEREPWRVREDVLDRAVSVEAARCDYGVILSGPELEVDEASTEACRAKERAERGAITWTFDRGEGFTERTGRARYE